MIIKKSNDNRNHNDNNDDKDNANIENDNDIPRTSDPTIITRITPAIFFIF